jgi:hypothetical protein
MNFVRAIRAMKGHSRSLRFNVIQDQADFKGAIIKKVIANTLNEF